MASIVFTLLRGVVFMIPAFYLLPDVLGNSGLWLAIPASEALTTIVIMIYFMAARNRCRIINI